MPFSPDRNNKELRNERWIRASTIMRESPTQEQWKRHLHLRIELLDLRHVWYTILIIRRCRSQVEKIYTQAKNAVTRV